MTDQYKSVDSSDEYKYTGCRLTSDPEVRDTKYGKMVSFKIVSTSRNKGKNDIDDLWVTVKPSDYYVEAASFLRAKDVLHEVKGKPVLRRFGEGKRMIEFIIERAQLHIPSELKKQLKERGWQPGQSSGSTPRPRSSNTSRREIEPLPED